jgi:hypothetical protein
MRSRRANRKWQVRYSANLDTRTPREKRLNDLMLAGIIGRIRPQMYGERGQQLLDETADLMLPWEIGD